MESDGRRGSAVGKKTPTGSTNRLFSAAQRSCLKAYYESGMRGTGGQFRELHHKCARESGLSVAQVTRWIKKESYNQRHAKGDQEVEAPQVKRTRQTTQHRHPEAVGSSEDGTTNDSASLVTPADESQKSSGWQKEAPLPCAGEEPAGRGGTGEMKKQAEEYFAEIRALFTKLEELKYRCLAFGFCEDDVQVVTTSDCTSCPSARCLEYLHALTAVANRHPPPPAAVVSESTANPAARSVSRQGEMTAKDSALPGKASRKECTSIDTYARQRLEAEFVNRPKPTQAQMAQLAAQLRVSKDFVRVWFSNRRQRQKRLESHGSGLVGSTIPSPDYDITVEVPMDSADGGGGHSLVMSRSDSTES